MSRRVVELVNARRISLRPLLGCIDPVHTSTSGAKMYCKILGSVAVLVASVAVFTTPVGRERLTVFVERCTDHLAYLQKHFKLPVPNHGPEVNLLLVGAAGNGRSALGNNIVGRSVFESRASATVVTRHNRVIRAEIGSRQLLVVDTPGLLGNQAMVETENVVENLKSSFTLSPKGYSAFLVVLNMANRITKEQIDAIKILEIVFGDYFFKHAVFVFTHKDLFVRSFDAGKNVAVEFISFIDNQPDDMADFIYRADDRVLFVNSLETRTVENRDFHIKLIHMVDDIARGGTYKKWQFDHAQELLKDEIRRKLEREEQERGEREREIWNEALQTCRCPSHDSGYKFNLNIKFPGSGFLMMAIDMLVGGFQKVFGWFNTPLLN